MEPAPTHNTTSTYTVETPVFSGPLELLLSLVEKRKLPINDVSLAEVTDDFMAYIAEHQEFPMLRTANFIVVASTLLLIKSKSLLPTLDLTQEEEESVEELERRLKLYRRFKKLSKTIATRFDAAPMRFPLERQRGPSVFMPGATVEVDALRAAVQRVIKELPQPQEKRDEAVVKNVVSLEEMIERLSERISSNMKMRFSEFSGDASKKPEVIVSFLALLELVKQGMVHARQEGRFEDIEMESNTVSVPRYS